VSLNPATGRNDVALPLTAPLELKQGEHLFVSIEMNLVQNSASKLVTCVVTCSENPQADRNYWSNTTQPPYQWTTLSSVGRDQNLLVSATSK
jgi:hypothetical protein